MNIDKAFEKARQGKKIRRFRWKELVYVVWRNNIDHFAMFHDPVNFTRYDPNDYDLVAYDWYVLEE
jgi:hypothetical protein